VRLRLTLSLTMITSVLAGPLRAEDPVPDPDADYVRVTNERADKIVATLGIDDDAELLRVRDLIAEWYRTLSRIDDARDAGSLAADEQLAAHRRFVARLEARLTWQQVEQVKDGLTYGVVPLTFHGYLELLPALTAEQKLEIKAQLLEAREFALDAGSANEKHAVFGEYKGRINNYLSKAGYDLKQAERARAAKPPRN
jgi:hypothetical protein